MTFILELPVNLCDVFGDNKQELRIHVPSVGWRLSDPGMFSLRDPEPRLSDTGVATDPTPEYFYLF